MTVNCGLLFGCKILRWDDYMISGLIVNYMRNQKIVIAARKERSECQMGAGCGVIQSPPR